MRLFAKIIAVGESLLTLWPEDLLRQELKAIVLVHVDHGISLGSVDPHLDLHGLLQDGVPDIHIDP